MAVTGPNIVEFKKINMNNLQKLREVIIKEIPEIVKLKFGCRIKWSYEHSLNNLSRCWLTKKGIIIGGHGSTNLVRILLYGNKTTRDVNLSSLEIIGRPITLADVLRVLRKKNEYGSKVDDRGIFWITDMVMELPGKKKYAWNLSENNLDLQSEKTIDFLTNLITKEDIK